MEKANGHTFPSTFPIVVENKSGKDFYKFLTQTSKEKSLQLKMIIE